LSGFWALKYKKFKILWEEKFVKSVHSLEDENPSYIQPADNFRDPDRG
jgi:hypothetical protein